MPEFWFVTFGLRAVSLWRCVCVWARVNELPLAAVTIPQYQFLCQKMLIVIIMTVIYLSVDKLSTSKFEFWVFFASFYFNWCQSKRSPCCPHVPPVMSIVNFIRVLSSKPFAPSQWLEVIPKIYWHYDYDFWHTTESLSTNLSIDVDPDWIRDNRRICKGREKAKNFSKVIQNFLCDSLITKIKNFARRKGNLAWWWSVRSGLSNWENSNLKLSTTQWAVLDCESTF